MRQQIARSHIWTFGCFSQSDGCTKVYIWPTVFGCSVNYSVRHTLATAPVHNSVKRRFLGLVGTTLIKMLSSIKVPNVNWFLTSNAVLKKVWENENNREVIPLYDCWLRSCTGQRHNLFVSKYSWDTPRAISFFESADQVHPASEFGVVAAKSAMLRRHLASTTWKVINGGTPGNESWLLVTESNDAHVTAAFPRFGRMENWRNMSFLFELSNQIIFFKYNGTEKCFNPCKV